MVVIGETYTEMKTKKARKHRRRVESVIPVENQVRKCYRIFLRHVDRMDNEFDRLFRLIENSNQCVTIVHRGSRSQALTKGARR